MYLQVLERPCKINWNTICQCKKLCFQRFTSEQQSQILEAFNALANQNLQDAHLFGLVSSEPVKRNLLLPHLPVGDIFYMQQLWLYVFGIHMCGNNEVKMCCWTEMQAKRGSDEVISMLDNCLSKLPSSVTSVRLYSDGCGGENKNANMMHYLFTLVAVGKFKHIRHTFPATGHSFLPNDRDFGRTELNKRKNERVYTPEQWKGIIEGARKRKPFQVIQPSQSIFLPYDQHFSPLFKKSLKSIGKEKKSFSIQKARVLEYSHDHSSQVWVKYLTVDDAEWTKFEPLKRGKKASLPPSTSNYTRLLPIKASKVSDLKTIVEKFKMSSRLSMIPLYTPTQQGQALIRTTVTLTRHWPLQSNRHRTGSTRVYA